MGGCVSKSGDQMTNDLNMRGNKITRLADPESHRDAVQKDTLTLRQ